MAATAEALDGLCSGCGRLSQIALDEPVFILRAKDILAPGGWFVRRGSCPAFWFHGAGAPCRDISSDVCETLLTTLQRIPRVRLTAP